MKNKIYLINFINYIIYILTVIIIILQSFILLKTHVKVILYFKMFIKKSNYINKFKIKCRLFYY